jgi:tetratricopeptide (TPR) repeat protein
VGRAYARANLGDQQAAIVDFGEALRLKPDRADIYLARGYSRASLEDRQGATEDFQRAARLFETEGDSARQQEAQDALRTVQGGGRTRRR